jgi:hypothetical protein
MENGGESKPETDVINVLESLQKATYWTM